MKKCVVFLLVFILVGCGKKSDSSKDTLVYGMNKEAVILDPAKVDDTASYEVLNSVCEGLVGYNEVDEIVPRLAESWTESDEGKTYTFKLRKGVLFHDGTSLNADAVLTSIKRQVGGGSFPYYIGTGMSENLVSVDKIDDLTVQLKIKEKDATFISKMSMPFMNIVSPKALSEKGEAFDRSPVCTGHFKFVKWEKGQQIVVERNDKYWKADEIPKIKTVVFKVVPDASARYLSLKKGSLDIAARIAPQDLGDLSKASELKAFDIPVMYMQYMFINTEKTPFGDKRVRQALAHLVDKDRIVKVALLGMGNAEKNPIPKALWGSADDIQDYEYNEEAAKKLLTEAGYPNGFEMEILYNSEGADRKATAEILQDSFSKVGIKVSVKPLEWGTFLSVSKNGNYNGGTLSGWGADFLDPDNFLTSLFSISAAQKPGLNMAFWKNVAFDQLIKGALRTTDKAERAKYYHGAQVIFHNEMPAIPIYSRKDTFGISKNVEGFIWLKVGAPYLYKVSK